MYYSSLYCYYLNYDQKAVINYLGSSCYVVVVVDVGESAEKNNLNVASCISDLLCLKNLN